MVLENLRRVYDLHDYRCGFHAVTLHAGCAHNILDSAANGLAALGAAAPLAQGQHVRISCSTFECFKDIYNIGRANHLICF